MKKTTILLAFAFVMILASCGKQEEPKNTEKQISLANLMTAFNGESNAGAKYEEFAKKADQEGYTKVASLFRAASQAEKFHAINHGEVIKKMGGTPVADIKLPEIKTTKENLEVALAGETYEKDKMYPEFIAAAKAEKNLDAVKAFNFAIQAEVEHAKFYTQALAELETWKDGKLDFLVCPVCGHTVLKSEFAKCPVCFTTRDKFILAN